MKITTLSENTAAFPEILAEHGISILIESKEGKILFDTGQSISVVHNSNSLGIDLSDLECIVLSHGHYDHTGGLGEVLRRTGEIEIFAHPDVFQKKYVKRKEGKRYIGIPYTREWLESRGAKFKTRKKPVEILDNIIATGEIERKSFEEVDRSLYVMDGDNFIRDEVLDDQALIVRTEKGLFILLGCAHSGVINTIEHAMEITGEKRVYGVVGGTHLGFSDEKRIEETIKFLKRYEIERIGVSHCTGMKASVKFASVFKERFFFNNAGVRFEI
ncbi:MAG: MBL fold metallo-hydrolase [Candidatus Syntropharchaeia archaeon]